MSLRQEKRLWTTQAKSARPPCVVDFDLLDVDGPSLIEAIRKVYKRDRHPSSDCLPGPNGK